MEIERKFLVQNEVILTDLKKNNIQLKKNKINQFYTQITANHETRFRQFNNDFFSSTKSGSGLIRDEIETSIDKHQYKKARQQRISPIIKKNRYQFLLDNILYELDIFSGFLKGLSLLEIEFADETTANNFVVPALFTQSRLLEVTEDSRFKNKSLALYGDPRIEPQLNQTLQYIEKNKIFAIKKLKNKSAYLAIKLICYHALLDLQKYINIFLAGKGNEALHQIRVNIRKLNTILQLTATVFNQDEITKLRNSLKKIVRQTNSKRDLDVLVENLPNYLTTKNTKILFLEELNAQINVQNQQIEAVLTSPQLTTLLTDLTFFLQDNKHHSQGKYADIAIEIYIKRIMIKQIKTVRKKFNQLTVDANNKQFHTSRIALKRLRYLIHYFAALIPEINSKFNQKEIAFLQDEFGYFQDRTVWLNIIAQQQAENSNTDNQLLLAKITQQIQLEIEQLKIQILKQKTNFIHLLNLQIKQLKNG